MVRLIGLAHKQLLGSITSLGFRVTGRGKKGWGVWGSGLAEIVVFGDSGLETRMFGTKMRLGIHEATEQFRQ